MAYQSVKRGREPGHVAVNAHILKPANSPGASSRSRHHLAPFVGAEEERAASPVCPQIEAAARKQQRASTTADDSPPVVKVFDRRDET